MEEQSYHKIEARFGLSMPKNRYNNLLFDHIWMDLNFSYILSSKFELSSPTLRGDDCRIQK